MRILIIIMLSLFATQACVSNKPIISEKQDIDPFWNSFNDEKLNSLVKESLNSNVDVLTMMINISKAQSSLGISQANRLPRIELNNSIVNRRDSDHAPAAFIHKPYDVFNVSAVLNYQFDIWGKMAAASNASKARLLALESTKRAVKITVASEVSKAYFNIVSLDNKVSILEKLISLDQKLEQIKLRQLKSGLIDAGEVQQVKSQLHLDKSQLLILKQKLVAQENALAVILGRDVSTSSISREKDLSNFKITDLPKDLPSHLLLKRPDIIAAEKMLEAAKYQVKVARASYFPEISLNALFGFSSQNSGNLFDKKSRAKLIEGRASIPLIDFGKTSDNVDLALADKSQHMLDYQHTIRVAFAEGITSLAANKNARENFIEHKASTSAVENNYNISNKQLKVGAIDYFSAINSEKNYLNSKSMLIDAAKQRLDSMVDVYKAFGGNTGLK